MNPEEAPDCWTYVSDWEAAGLLVILLFLLHILTFAISLSSSYRTMALYIKCEFPLPGAERVALVWDGKKRFIECTSGNYEGSFDVHFGNEKSILVHFWVDNKTSDKYDLPRPHPSSSGLVTYTMSVKRTGDGLSISAEETSTAKSFTLVPIMCEGKSIGGSCTVPRESKLSREDRQKLLAESQEDLEKAITTLPSPPPPTI